MKQNDVHRIRYILIWVNIVLILTTVTMLKELVELNKSNITYGENAKLIKLMGFYKHDKYYCVWTGNYSWDDINDTEYHEACHDQVYKRPKHFCEKYCEFD